MIDAPLCACGCGATITSRDYKGNFRTYLIGHHWMGKTKSPETREKIRQTKLGERNARWKGDRAGYAAVHNWLFRHYSKTGICDECGKERKTEWANISGLYRHSRDDFAELCIPCHRKSDRVNPKRHLKLGATNAS